MKFLHTFLIAFIMLSSFSLPLKAEDELFVVRDTGSGLEETFETYNSASSFYEEHLEEYDNLLLYEDDRLIRMEYGIVEFNTNEACGLDIDYFSQSKNEDDILNGCYGIDGAYLDTDYRNDRVYFMISDDLGYTSLNNVTLHPYEALESDISVYHNGDHFYHNIKSQLDYDFYSYSLELDDKLSDLGVGDYYSYDGHYFYDDFKAMIDDYRNGTRDNSVNDGVYYNYYQFLPHRSLSNYTSSELNEYINETLAINGRLDHYDDSNFDSAADEVNRSQLYGNIEHFFIAQSLYGTNAMMLLSSAIYESSYGRSYPSYANNNLYLSAAYESEAENETRHYDSIADSIYAHSRYFISSRYSNHRRSDYRGTFYGDKASGINVNYSLDSYFGEKSASAYYHLDSLLGNKDRNDKAVGIISDRSSANFYYDEDLERRRFTLYDITKLSFVILEESENSYKINIDDSNNEDYEYDFSGSIAYVAKDVFSHILNEDRIADYELNYKFYDLKGGMISDHEQLELLDTCEIKPYREHYEYDDIDEEGNVSYRYIEAIDLIRPFKTAVELGGTIDLRGGLIRVFYEDSTYKDVPIDSDMISDFDMHQEGTQDIRISYNGVAIDTKIEVSEEFYELDRDFSMAINEKNYQFVKENLLKTDHQFTFEEIRQIDRDLLKDSKRNYYIDDKTGRYDISISGLELALAELDGLKYFGDTYYVLIRSIPYFDNSTLKKYAAAYDFDIVDGQNLDFRFNFEKIEPEAPVIISLNIPEKRSDLIYSVYHLDKNGDIVKMRTTQSDNYIQYMAKESGSYIVLSKESANEYHIADYGENLSFANMGVDNHRYNFKMFMILVIALIGIIGIVFYYVLNDRNEKLWKEFKKSLRTPDFVQEEKPKN